MAHYAKVVDGIVTEVIVADSDYINTFVDNSPGEWVQTSYNTYGGQHYDPETNEVDDGTPLRKNFAAIGDHYDGTGFYTPKPFGTWVFNDTTYLWEPPIPMPDDGRDYYWDEEVHQNNNSEGWVLHEGDH